MKTCLAVSKNFLLVKQLFPKSTNLLVQHYLSTKHAIFLAIIVGGLATPSTNYFIVAIDTVFAVFDGWKVVRKYRQCPSDGEGNLIQPGTTILCMHKYNNLN